MDVRAAIRIAEFFENHWPSMPKDVISRRIVRGGFVFSLAFDVDHCWVLLQLRVKRGERAHSTKLYEYFYVINPLQRIVADRVCVARVFTSFERRGLEFMDNSFLELMKLEAQIDRLRSMASIIRLCTAAIRKVKRDISDDTETFFIEIESRERMPRRDRFSTYDLPMVFWSTELSHAAT